MGCTTENSSSITVRGKRTCCTPKGKCHSLPLAIQHLIKLVLDVTGILSAELKQPGHEACHSLIAEVRNEWNFNSISRHTFMACTGTTLLLHLLIGLSLSLSLPFSQVFKLKLKDSDYESLIMTYKTQAIFIGILNSLRSLFSLSSCSNMANTYPGYNRRVSLY